MRSITVLSPLIFSAPSPVWVRLWVKNDFPCGVLLSGGERSAPTEPGKIASGNRSDPTEATAETRRDQVVGQSKRQTETWIKIWDAGNKERAAAFSPIF